MSEWKEIKLGELLNVITKGTTPPKGIGFVDKGINYVKSDAIGYDRKLDKTKIAHINEETHQSFKRSQLAENDILFSMAGIYLGKNAIVTKDILPANTNQALAILRLNQEKANPTYVSLYLSQQVMIDYVNNMSGQSAQPNVNFEEIKSIEIKLPPISEQTAIASVLSSLDDKIDLLHRQNATLEKMAETLFRQWFVEEAKEEWKEGVLSDEFDFTMGQSPSGSSFNEEGIGIPMYQGNADFGFRFPERRVFTTDPQRFAQKYDTLVSVRAPVGDQNMANEKCCIGRGVAAFRYRKNNEFYSYTYFKLKSLMDGIKQFNETGTVFGSIGKSDFENLNITIPPIEITDKFQKNVKPIDDKIITNVNQIRTLSTMRDTLLPKLMSGEIRIKMN